MYQWTALVTIFLTAAAVPWFTPAAAVSQEPRAAEPSPPDYKVGSELRKSLEQEAGITWDKTPLGGGLARFSQVHGIAILLDRRIDPTQEITLTQQNLPLQSVLESIAQRAQAEKAVVANTIYFGPFDTAKKLPTVAALRRRDAQLLPTGPKAAWLKSTPGSYPRLTIPRELVTTLVTSTGAKLLNPEAIPHDVWRDASLPAMPVVDQLSLILAQFDRQIEISKDGLLARVTPLPDNPTYDHTYAAKGRGGKLATDLRRMFPEATITPTSDEVRVVARFEDHETINRLVRGEQVRSTQVRTGEKRYTLTVENQPAGAVAKTIATQLKLTLVFDAEVAQLLAQNVSFQVKDVTLEELLREALGPLKLTYRQTDTALEIVQEMP